MGEWKLLVIGIVMILIGGFLIWLSIRGKLRCKIEAEGEVVGVERKHRGKYPLYYPVMEYLANGKMIHGTADIDSRFSTKFKKGQMMTVLYNENDPDEFVIKGKSFRSDFFGGLFLAAIGIFAIVLQFWF